MKYNRSEIMKRAHAIRKETGANMSKALTAAWIEAKITIIADKKFYLSMKDRWSHRDSEEDMQMTSELSDLRYRLWEVQKAA